MQDNNISREDFDGAVQRMQELNDDHIARGFSLDEEREIPNGDIIFTFDMDIIRYFYRRE